MEAQLAAYRAKKSDQFEKKPNSYHHNFGTWFRSKMNQNTQSQTETEQKPVGQHQQSSFHGQSNTSSDSGTLKTQMRYFDEVGQVGDVSHSPIVTKTRILSLLKLVLWLICWGLFLEVGFGAVFFAVSLLTFIYFSTKTGPKSSGAPSAYSVFNPNCERIDGTITAEQFEKELRFGAVSVH